VLHLSLRAVFCCTGVTVAVVGCCASVSVDLDATAPESSVMWRRPPAQRAAAAERISALAAYPPFPAGVEPIRLLLCKRFGGFGRHCSRVFRNRRNSAVDGGKRQLAGLLTLAPVHSGVTPVTEDSGAVASKSTETLAQQPTTATVVQRRLGKAGTQLEPISALLRLHVELGGGATGARMSTAELRRLRKTREQWRPNPPKRLHSSRRPPP
jgi:hypothetical protein